MDQKKYKILKTYVNISLAISIPTGFFILSLDNFISAINEGIVYGILVISLFVVTLAWFANYIHTNVTDLETFSSLELIENIPSITIREFLLVASISLLFGVLISTTSNIIVYASVATIFEIFDIFADLKVMKSFNQSLKKEIFGNETRKHSIKIVSDFWFDNPTIQRDVLILISFFGCLIMAVIYHYTHTSLFRYLSYFIAILTILIAEFNIYKWRKIRDEKLDSLEETNTQ